MGSEGFEPPSAGFSVHRSNELSAPESLLEKKALSKNSLWVLRTDKPFEKGL